MLKISSMILALLWCQYGHAQNKYILSIKDAITNQPLSGVDIYTEEMNSAHTGIGDENDPVPPIQNDPHSPKLN